MNPDDSEEDSAPESEIRQKEMKIYLPVDENNNPQVFCEEAEKMMDCSYMGLKMVPDCIHNHHFVEVLDLSRNELNELPESLVTTMPLLRCLDVTRNRLKSLPTDIGNWKHLCHINASQNELVTIPVSLADNTELNYLKLDGNPLSSDLLSYFDALPEVWNATTCGLFAQEIRLLLLQMKWINEMKNKFERLRIAARSPQQSKAQSQQMNGNENQAGADLAFQVQPHPAVKTTLALWNSTQYSITGSNMETNDASNRTGSRLHAALSIGNCRNRKIVPKASSLPAVTEPVSNRMKEANRPSKTWNLFRSLLVIIVIGALDLLQLATYLVCTGGVMVVSAGLLVDKELTNQFMQWGIFKYIPDNTKYGLQFLCCLFGAHFASLSIYVPIYRAPPRGIIAAQVTFLTAIGHYFLDSWIWRAFYDYCF